jgi:outer membrane protein TolC
LVLVETKAPLDSLVQQALQQRPELKQNRDLQSSARAAKNGAVYGPLVPSLNAEAFVGGLGGGKSGSVGSFGQSEDYFVGLGWRIGPGGLFDFGKVRSHEARLETAKLNVEKIHDEIVREVVENQTRTQSLSDQLVTARQNLATATELLRLTKERKQYGVGVVLEDIQSQQDLTSARLGYLNAIAEYNKAQYALSRAIGGVLQPAKTR